MVCLQGETPFSRSWKAGKREWCLNPTVGTQDPSPVGPFAAYCTAPQKVPEQINLQVASPEVAVVGFVTYEDALPAGPPIAKLAKVR